MSGTVLSWWVKGMGELLEAQMMRLGIALGIALGTVGAAQAAPPAPAIKTGYLVFSPLGAAPVCPGGTPCLYALASDGLIYQVDQAGNALRVGTAKAIRTSPNCSALASPANGDVCYDTSASAFRFYSSGWQTPAVNDSLLVHKAGSESITGAKTFTVSPTFSAGATLGGNLVAGSQKITGLAQGTASGEAVHAGRAIGTTAPLTGGGDLTGDLTLGISLASPLVVQGGQLNIESGGLVYLHLTGAAPGALGAATVYLRVPGQVADGTEYQLARTTRGGGIRNLYCKLGTAPGLGESVTVTARHDSADLALACSITNLATSCSNTSTILSVLSGHDLSLKAVSTGAVAADLVCGFEQTN